MQVSQLQLRSFAVAPLKRPLLLGQPHVMQSYEECHELRAAKGTEHRIHDQLRIRYRDSGI